MCAAPLEGTLPRTEQRWIFVDLKDLHLPGYLAGAGGYAEVAAHIYERFVPFADDGWEPTTLPGDPAFDLWVYEHVQGELRIIGVNLLSRRSGPQRVWTDRPHHVAQRRTEQLTGFAWTTEPGSKVLKRPAPHTSG